MKKVFILFGILIVFISIIVEAQQLNFIYSKEEITFSQKTKLAKKTLIVRFKGTVNEIMWLDAGFLSKSAEIIESYVSIVNKKNKVITKVKANNYLVKTTNIRVKIIIWNNLLIVGSYDHNFMSKILIMKFQTKQKKYRLKFINFTLIEERYPRLPGLNSEKEVNGFYQEEGFDAL